MRLKTLGLVKIEDSELNSRKYLLLLAYLRLEKSSYGFSRKHLEGLLWPEVGEPQSSLNVAVSTINREFSNIIQSAPDNRLELDSKKVFLVDAEELETACKQQDVAAIKALYKGPFMDDYENTRLIDDGLVGWIEKQRAKFNTLVWKVWLGAAKQQGEEGYKILEQGYTTAHKRLPSDDELLQELYVLLKTAKSDLVETVRQDAKERRVKLPVIKDEIPEVKSLLLSKFVPIESPSAALSPEISVESPVTSVVLEPSQPEIILEPSAVAKEAVAETSWEAKKEAEQNLPEPPPIVGKEEPPKSGVKDVAPTPPASPANLRLSTLLGSRFLKFGLLALVSLCVLALLAWFFVPRSTSLELEASVTGLSFTLAEPQLLLTGVAVTALDVRDVASLRLPPITTLATVIGGEVIEPLSNALLSLSLRSSTQSPMLVFPNDLVLPAGSQVTLRLAEESSQKYALEVRPSLPVEVALKGEVEVLVRNGTFSPEVRNYGLGKPLTLTPGDKLSLFFTPTSETVFLAPELAIRDLSFILNEPSKPGQGLPLEYSAIVEGSLKTGNKTQTLGEGDRLSLTKLTGRLLRLSLEPSLLRLRFKGEAEGIHVE
jgi:hypothetical protein